MFATTRIRARSGNTIAVSVLGPDAPNPAAAAVFIHPINLRKEAWLGLVKDLCRQRPCISIDLAGHGESSDAPAHSLQQWADDCVDACQELGVRSAHVVGGSLGGAIATAVASDPSIQARTLTALGSDLYSEEPADAFLDRLEAVGPEQLFREVAALSVAPDSDPSLLQTVATLANSHGAAEVSKVWRATVVADARPHAARVSCPALVLTGEYDTTCPPAGGREMAERLRGEHRLLDGVGHLPMLESSARIATLLTNHFQLADGQTL